MKVVEDEESDNFALYLPRRKLCKQIGKNANEWLETWTIFPGGIFNTIGDSQYFEQCLRLSMYYESDEPTVS